MRPSVAAVHDLLSGLRPGDALEAEHRQDTLNWLERTDDVFRRTKPATPDRHLVSYVVLRDTYGRVLLVDHINARLWLPAGGHVEPDEHPEAAARREALEELGVDATPSLSFVTVTRTVGIDSGHTDVSLWFTTEVNHDQPLTPDPREFHEARWWTPEEIAASDPARFDPHLGRFMSKMAAASGFG